MVIIAAVDWNVARKTLLRWYAANARSMPWRVGPGELADPYRVLVSEVMLQQTQVATVVDYFHRFIEQFPTIRALARADEQQVLRSWQGLGYYRRARMLHQAAKMVVTRHRGRMPQTVTGLLELPGIGRYTAGAVASIAFGACEPVVDGNVARVLARLTGERQPADHPQVLGRTWDAMGELVRMRRGRFGPGDVNQSVMELGAVVCLPRGPRCAACPVRRMCAAHLTGEPQRFGAKAARKLPRPVTHRIIAIHRGTRWLFEQRPDEGLWAGMWQMPTWESVNGDDAAAMTLAARERYGLSLRPAIRIGEFQHVTTHRRIRFEIYSAAAGRGGARRRRGLWRKLEEIADLPLSNAQRRAVAVIRDTHALFAGR